MGKQIHLHPNLLEANNLLRRFSGNTPAAMAEALGLAASTLTVIELSAKVATLCLEYSAAAKSDIERLRGRVNSLSTTVQDPQRLLDGPHGAMFATSRKLLDSLGGCASELVDVQKRLDPGTARKAMRRVGFRALKWPFDSKEVGNIIGNLERYEQTITLGLQVNQTGHSEL